MAFILGYGTVRDDLSLIHALRGKLALLAYLEQEHIKPQEAMTLRESLATFVEQWLTLYILKADISQVIPLLLLADKKFPRLPQCPVSRNCNPTSKYSPWIVYFAICKESGDTLMLFIFQSSTRLLEYCCAISFGCFT